MILGLDISTSNTGWCILDESTGDLVDIGFINLSKKKNLIDKAEVARLEIERLVAKYNISRIAVEENLQSFRSGFSSAHTLSTLARFNGIVSYIVFLKTGLHVQDINVSTARKNAGIKVKREKICGISTKDQVLGWVAGELPSFTWPVRTPTRGKNKGKEIFVNQCYDMADAYVIARACIALNN